jgi:Skp family chaperone for outer membrane proteins
MTLKLATGAFAIMFAGAAFAQAGTKPAAPQAPQSITRARVTAQVDAEFKRLDANGDGKINKAEIQAAVDKMTANTAAEIKKRQDEEFSKLDTDKNGQLSLAEYEAGVKITPKAGAADQRLQAFDTNKDGVITPAEFRSKPLAEFDAVDTNKDGVISEAELKAAASRR